MLSPPNRLEKIQQRSIKALLSFLSFSPRFLAIFYLSQTHCKRPLTCLCCCKTKFSMLRVILDLTVVCGGFVFASVSINFSHATPQEKQLPRNTLQLVMICMKVKNTEAMKVGESNFPIEQKKSNLPIYVLLFPVVSVAMWVFLSVSK